jgi:hypothetical protein
MIVVCRVGGSTPIKEEVDDIRTLLKTLERDQE